MRRSRRRRARARSRSSRRTDTRSIRTAVGVVCRSELPFRAVACSPFRTTRTKQIGVYRNVDTRTTSYAQGNRAQLANFQRVLGVMGVYANQMHARDDDAALVRRMQTGDEQAFEAIFKRHHAPLLSYC